MAILLCRSAFSDALFERGGLPDKFMRFCWVEGGGFTLSRFGGGGAFRADLCCCNTASIEIEMLTAVLHQVLLCTNRYGLTVLTGVVLYLLGLRPSRGVPKVVAVALR